MIPVKQLNPCVFLGVIVRLEAGLMSSMYVWVGVGGGSDGQGRTGEKFLYFFWLYTVLVVQHLLLNKLPKISNTPKPAFW